MEEIPSEPAYVQRFNDKYRPSALAGDLTMLGVDITAFQRAVISPESLDVARAKFMREVVCDYDTFILEHACRLVQERLDVYLPAECGTYIEYGLAHNDGVKHTFLRDLCRDSSVGQPFQHVDNVSTKAEWLELHSVELMEWVVHCMQKCEVDPLHPFTQRYLQDDPPAILSLKREMRPRARVEAKRTRLFVPTGIGMVALITALFGPLFSVMHEESLQPNFWIRVGYRFQYGGFSRLINLHSRRKTSADDDCGGFDMSLPMQLLAAAIRIVCMKLPVRYRKFGESVMMREINYRVYDPLGRGLRKHHGNASGSRATSDLNSVVRCIIKTYEILVFLSERGHNPLDTTVEQIDGIFTVSIYGDDCLTSFDDADDIGLSADTYSQAFMKRACAQLNIDLEPGTHGRLGEKSTFLGKSVKWMGTVPLPVPSKPMKLLCSLAYDEVTPERADAVLDEFAFTDWFDRLYDVFLKHFGKLRSKRSHQMLWLTGVAE
jgi:hypothetical protein